MDLVERYAFELVGVRNGTVEEVRARLGEIHGRVHDEVVVLREGDRLFVGVPVDAGTHPPPGMDATMVDAARWVRATGVPFERLEAWAIERGHEPEDVTLTIGNERWVRLKP